MLLASTYLSASSEHFGFQPPNANTYILLQTGYNEQLIKIIGNSLNTDNLA